MTPLIRYEQIIKTYPASNFKLGPCNLSFGQGELIAVLGKNGAGKSTFFELTTANARLTSGKIYLKDEVLLPDKVELRRNIGYLPQNQEVPEWVTGREIITYAVNLHQIPMAKEAIEQSMEFWDFKGYADKPMATCSHGMKKRIGLSIATIHNPSLLVLDEPFSGLDLYHIKTLETYLEKRKREGKTTILSTHIIPFVAKMADYCYLIKEGKFDHLPIREEPDYMKRIDFIEANFFSKSDTPKADT
jgi:ABC-2 type transport system ATP-binding protein